MNKHLDYWGASIEVGDIVLGATARKDHFRHNDFDVCLVTGKTSKMIRVHKLGSNKKEINLLNTALLKRVEERFGRPVGASHPCNFIKLRETGLTEVEIKDALDKGAKHVTYRGSLSSSTFAPFLP